MTFDDRERCETCRAFDAKDQECRRHAPTAVMVPGVSALSQQPTMNVLGLWSIDAARALVPGLPGEGKRLMRIRFVALARDVIPHMWPPVPSDCGVYIAVTHPCPRCLKMVVGIARSKKKARRKVYALTSRPHYCRPEAA